LAVAVGVALRGDGADVDATAVVREEVVVVVVRRAAWSCEATDARWAEMVVHSARASFSNSM
jgi:hypothetical protein